jgi:hypothetical protein
MNGLMPTTKYSVSIILFALLVLTLIAPALSSLKVNADPFPVVYVNAATGNDGYDGSSPVYTGGITGPKKTIEAGISVVAGDGTVNVASGIYHEYNLDLSQTMNLAGAGAATTIIDADARGYVIKVSSAPGQRNTISGLTIRDGAFSGSNAGGGIYISESHIVTINDCAIIDNTKGGGSGPLPSRGGGICNDGGELYMNRCTISGNTVNGNGGGIYTRKTFGGDSGLVELTNCTIVGNTVTTAGGSGGGICCQDNGSVRTVNVTIADNQVTGTGSHGGGFANISDSLDPVGNYYFTNCIVSNNTAGDGIHNNGYDIYNGASIHSLGRNIDSENSCYFIAATDKTNTNPLLGPLQDNGGPTSTCAITQDSPAYNAGTNTGAPTSDQRDVSRPQMAIYDIGAYEFSISNVATATGTGIAVFSTNVGGFNNLTPMAAVQCGTPPGIGFPHGFFSYTIEPVTPGATVTITIILPSNMPDNTQYWKCINNQWVDVTSLLGDNDGDNILTLTLTDGGPGDADRQVNGSIADPGGPGTLMNASEQTSFSTFSAESPNMPEHLIALPANIILKSVNLQPQQALANQPVTIYANVANSGDEIGNYKITLKINGVLEQVKEGNISGHAAAPLKFEVIRDKPGTYAIDLNGQSTYFTIIDNHSETDSTKTAFYIVLVVCGIGIIISSVILVRRRYTNN